MTWEEFVSNVQQWARERGIYEHSTPDAQLLKALSELGELADAVIKNDREALKDAIGDVAVCMVNYAKMADVVLPEEPAFGRPVYSDEHIISVMCSILGCALRGLKSYDDNRDFARALSAIAFNNSLDFLECCAAAWNEIKDRKGQMVEGGVFVKEEASAEQCLAELKDEMARLEEQMEAIGAGGVTSGQKMIRGRQ